MPANASSISWQILGLLGFKSKTGSPPCFCEEYFEYTKLSDVATVLGIQLLILKKTIYSIKKNRYKVSSQLFSRDASKDKETIRKIFVESKSASKDLSEGLIEKVANSYRRKYS